MIDCHDVDDAARNLQERRWFALSARIDTLRDQCEVQRQVRALAESALQDLCAQLADFEALRDSLGERLAECPQAGRPAPAAVPRYARSAA